MVLLRGRGENWPTTIGNAYLNVCNLQVLKVFSHTEKCMKHMRLVNSSWSVFYTDVDFLFEGLYTCKYMCVRDDRTIQSAENISGGAALLHNPPQSQTAGADCSPRSALQPRCLIALWIYSSRITKLYKAGKSRISLTLGLFIPNLYLSLESKSFPRINVFLHSFVVEVDI